jgi:hypothetical protein
LIFCTKRGIDDSHVTVGFRGFFCTLPSSAVFFGNADEKPDLLKHGLPVYFFAKTGVIG